jgi:hypothetical protein
LPTTTEGLNVFYHLVDSQVAALLNAALGPVLPGERTLHQALPGCICPKCAAPLRQEIRLVPA